MRCSLFKDRLFIVVLVGSAFMLTLTIFKPLGYDNTLMQAMALDFYKYHRAPYLGIWIHDFPGIIYIHYFGMLLLGTSDIALRFFDCIIQLLFAGFLYRFWQRWFNRKMSSFLALLYVAYYVSAGSLLLSERDVYGAMLIFLSVDFLIRARSKPTLHNGWIFAAGIVAGLHIFLRPMALVYLAVLAVSLFFTTERTFRWRAWPNVVFLIIVGLAPLAFLLERLWRVPNGPVEFYRQVVLWNADLYAPITHGMLTLFEEIGRRALLLPLGIYGMVYAIRVGGTFSVLRRPAYWEKLLFVALLFSSLAIALGMRKYFSYHFAPFFMLLLPLSAIGIEAIAARRRAQRLTIIVLAFLSTFITYYPKSPAAFLFALAQNQNPWTATYDFQFPDPYWGGAEERATALYLEEPAQKAGLVEICSFDPHLRLHCGHPCMSRYIVLDALALRTDFQDAGKPLYTDYQKDWQRAYVDSLIVKQPRFIVLARNTSFVYLNDPYLSCLRFLPRFDSLLAASYRYDTSFGGYQIYRICSDTLSG